MSADTLPPVLSAVDLDLLLRQHPAIRLLDVRTPGEYAAMHLPGAYNVPIDTLGEHAAEIHAHVADQSAVEKSCVSFEQFSNGILHRSPQ